MPKVIPEQKFFKHRKGFYIFVTSIVDGVIYNGYNLLSPNLRHQIYKAEELDLDWKPNKADLIKGGRGYSDSTEDCKHHPATITRKRNSIIKQAAMALEI